MAATVRGHSRDMWETVEAFIVSREVVVDRPAGTAHPRFPETV